MGERSSATSSAAAPARFKRRLVEGLGEGWSELTCNCSLSERPCSCRSNAMQRVEDGRLEFTSAPAVFRRRWVSSGIAAGIACSAVSKQVQDFVLAWRPSPCGLKR